MQHKNRNFYNLFLLISGSFPFSWSIFHLDVSTMLLFFGKSGVLGLPHGGYSYDQGGHCQLFWNEIWVFERLFLLVSLGLPMLSRAGYRVYVCFLYKCTLIVLHYSWKHQIWGPSRGLLRVVQKLIFLIFSILCNFDQGHWKGCTIS